MDLLALRPFHYGSPRRRLNRGDAFRAVTARDFKVLVAAGLAQPGRATYETTDVVASPVAKRGRFAPLQRKDPPAEPMTTATAAPIVRRSYRDRHREGDR